MGIGAGGEGHHFGGLDKIVREGWLIQRRKDGGEGGCAEEMYALSGGTRRKSLLESKTGFGGKGSGQRVLVSVKHWAGQALKLDRTWTWSEEFRIVLGRGSLQMGCGQEGTRMEWNMSSSSRKGRRQLVV